MQASHSAKPGTKSAVRPAAGKQRSGARPPAATPPRRRSFGWLIAFALLAATGFLAFALPASLTLRFLPPDIHASESSGTLWHGSFAQLSVRGRPAGAVEWRLHPLSLLSGSVSAEVHWVQQGFVADSTVDVNRKGISARNVKGSGSLEDLADVGISRGWTGTLDVAIDSYAVSDQKVTAAAGSITVSHLSSKQYGVVDLGDFELQFDQDSVHPDGTASATVRDLRGLIQLNGTLSIAPAQNLATLTGALKERGEPPAELRQALNSLVQMRGRDRQGQIPVDLEFTL